MKYMIAIETTQYIEVEAETEDAAIETVQKQLDSRVAAAAHYKVVKELTFDEESNSYKMI
jgi:hypothetical protein